MNIKDYKWTEKRFGTRFAKILKGLGFSEENTEDIKVTDANGKVKTLVTDSNFKSILAKNGTLTEVTWQELKNKRDAGKLTPGALYRITDYQCTTIQENTRSAGHQFDIVLLALSANKLAEEGWAMMHDNIYDVTFADGVTKKCWIYRTPDFDNIVDINTLLGTQDIFLSEDADINEETKTIIITNEQYTSSWLSVEGLPYNYFQNSNLSAWKVWYCLDNDKSRFAWADDSMNGEPLSVIVSGTFSGMYSEDIKCKRNPLKDATFEGVHYFNFDGNRPGPSVNIYTETLDITLETKWYEISFNSDNIPAFKRELNDVVVSSVIPSTETPNGRGVIYRLVDEWNNDVPYDFKNIQFVRPMSGGGYDPDSGEDAWVYTFNTYSTDIEYVDSSNVGRCTCYSNYITPASINNVLTLPNNVLLISEGRGINVINSKDCTVIGDSVTLNACTNCIVGTYYGTLICCNDFRVYEDDEGIYINNKKVLTES